MRYTTIFGVIYDAQGKPYKGAIVKFSLNSPFKNNNRYFHNSEVRTVTNKFGIFELDLAPSVLDMSGENYYNVTVVMDTVTTVRVVVPLAEESIDFSTLEEYVFPYERQEFIGDNC